MDVTLDVKVCKAFEIMAYVLAEMPGAPLKQALLDAGIGTDIDVDFCYVRRPEVIDYVTRKYGEDRVSQIFCARAILL